MASDSFADLLTQLRDHPEWREDLRRVVLTDELLALPGVVADLAQGQRVLVAQVGQLAERMDQLAARMDQLAARMDQLTEQVTMLAKLVERQGDKVSMLQGMALEDRYRNKVYAYFQGIARRLRLLSPDQLDDLLDEGVEAGAITDEDATNVRRADIVARGRWDDGEVYLVIEVSWSVDLDDVDRAVARARSITATGRRAIPVVAGRRIDDEAQTAAPDHGVWMVRNGSVTAPPPRAA